MHEAGEQLITRLEGLGVAFDRDFVRLGIVLHDAGKILHPEELRAKGSQHEAEGEALLLDHGVAPALARCCRSHAQWATMECSLEELLVALADTLWKGARKTELEARVIDEVARRLDLSRWEVFLALDSCFEAIAEEGPARLERSR